MVNPSHAEGPCPAQKRARETLTINITPTWKTDASSKCWLVVFLRQKDEAIQEKFTVTYTNYNISNITC